MTGPTLERQRAVTRAARMVERGNWSARRAAEQCGVSAEAVCYRLRQRNGPRQRPRADRAEVIRRILDGHRYLDIAVDLDISVETVSYIASKHKIRSPLLMARQETKRRAIEMLLAGADPSAVCEALNLSREAVGLHRKSLGMTMPDYNQRHAERNAKIVQAVQQEGLTYSEAAERFGITRNAVSGVIHREKYRSNVNE